MESNIIMRSYATNTKYVFFSLQQGMFKESLTHEACLKGLEPQAV